MDSGLALRAPRNDDVNDHQEPLRPVVMGPCFRRDDSGTCSASRNDEVDSSNRAAISGDQHTVQFKPEKRTMPLDLNALLTANDEVAQHLAWSFDYRIDLEAHVTDWFTIDGIDTYRHIGREGAGGVFIELPDKRVLYASSEG